MRSGKEYLLQLPLTGDYDPTIPGIFQLGQGFPDFSNEVIKGLYLPTENEITGSPVGINGGVNVTLAQIQSLYFSFADENSNIFCENLPGRALVILPGTDNKKGAYYEIGKKINFEKSMIQVVSAFAALPAGQFYVLNIGIVT